ncbi:MAG: hypothetical protein ACLGGW_07705 [Gammaproteobacteria bacterium]
MAYPDFHATATGSSILAIAETLAKTRTQKELLRNELCVVNRNSPNGKTHARENEIA